MAFPFLRNLFLLLSVFELLPFCGYSYRLSGIIGDDASEPVPFVSVYVNKTTYATSSDIKGQYALELANGEYEIVFQLIGYEKKIIPVSIKENNVILNVSLATANEVLQTIVVQANKEDPANAIIRNAIAAKDKYRHPLKEYYCHAYIKASLEKEFLKHKDSTAADKLTKERMNFSEAYSEIYYRAPNNLKEVRLAAKDYQSKQKTSGVKINFSTDADKSRTPEMNINLFKTKIADADLNFYQNNSNVPVLSAVPFVSPLSDFAFLSYKYHFEEYLYENGRGINKIKIIPKRTDAALFNGYIYIVDSIWCIKAIDVEADPATLNYFKRFHIYQQYTNLSDSLWMLGREDFLYHTKEGRKTILGNTYINYTDYNTHPEIKKGFFNNELLLIREDAFEKDNSFWKELRPQALKTEEVKFVTQQDGIESFHKSAKYLHREDSTENKIKWYEFFTGMRFQNSFTKQYLNIDGIGPNALKGIFGVGGYRQHLSFSGSKEWNNAFKIEGSYALHYGFRNKDTKGNADISFLYLPKKFGRLHAYYGDDYALINSYDALSSVLSMSNYIRLRAYKLGNEIELLNGLYLDLTAEYDKKDPIDNLVYSKWTTELFGNHNTGKGFTGFDKFSVDATLKYTFGQKYITEPHKKVIAGSKYPTIALNYRKGIPIIMNSIAIYDFIELRAWDNIKTGGFGESKWKVFAGEFLNSRSVRFTENKFFRRSDVSFFSDPMKSFQLLDSALSTTAAYLQLNYLHRFNGCIMNKIPLIKKMKLLEVAGAGALFINQNNFRHAEVYGGLERPININRWKMRLKIGVYYVSSLNSYSSSKVAGSFKFGIDMFNFFTNSWSY